MVAIVTGNGFGLFNASNNVLGNLGVLGDGTLGQARGQAYVNAATGDLVLQFQDQELAGIGANVQALRTYNSLGTMSDGLGADWSFDAEATVMLTGTLNATGSTVTRTTGDGHAAVFTWNPSAGTSGEYTSDEGAGAQDTLAYDSTHHQWVFTDGSSQTVERYSDSSTSGMIGQLLSRVDTSGNETDFGYDPTSHLLTTITDKGSKQQIQLVYGTVSATVAGVTKSVSRVVGINTYTLNIGTGGTATLGTALSQVSYSYDTSGRLKSVSTDLTLDNSTTDDNVYTTSYTYAGTSNEIASVSQSDGSSVSFTYDGSGRVATVTDASGTQSFTYNAATAATGTTAAIPANTVITDGSGQKWTYFYDSSNRLIEIDSPAPTDSATAPKTQFSYDSRGNVIEVTQVTDANVADNQSVFYAYDANDNQFLQRDSQGNTITRTFGTSNQLLTETHYLTADPNGLNVGVASVAATNPLTAYYVYDSQDRLRFSISAQGRVSEYRYTSAGQLSTNIEYAGALFDLTTIAATSGQLSQLTTWASSQNQTQTELTQFTYDPRGNLSGKTQFATVNSSGVGVLDSAATVSNYTYDAYGQLLQTIAMRGGSSTAPDTTPTILTSFTYDGMGRVISQVNANETLTSTYVNNQITTTSNATGLTEIRTYDAEGRLISLSNTGNATGAAGGANTTRTTQYFYDAAGRLAMTLDPVGNESFNLYDADGRLQYTVDPTGAVCGYTYNSAGQMASQTHYAAAANTTGWVTATTTTNNSTTPPTTTTVYTLNKNALTVAATAATGVDVVSSATQDRTTLFAYDTAGRLQTKTDAVGTVTTYAYDGDSRITSTAVGASTTASSAVTANNRVTRYYYDADGNQVGVLDALGYLTENKYDAAGRLTETIQYNTRSLIATDLPPPVWIGGTNTNVTGGQPFSYRVPAFDPNGNALKYNVIGTIPSWLNVSTDPDGVTLSGTPPTALTSYSVTLQATDGTVSANTTVSITVVNAPPTWGTLPDVSVVAETAGFTYTLPAASDDVSTASQLSYSINSSTLPPGLTASGATITGTPTIPGVYTVLATVTDSGKPPLSTQRSFVIQVTDLGPTAPSVSPQNAVRTQLFSMVVPAATQPEGQTLTYQLVSGPSWLSFNASTMTLSGTPPLSAPLQVPQTVKLLVQDPTGASTILSFPITIVNMPPTWPALGALNVPAGQTIAYTPPAAKDPEGEAVTYSILSINGVANAALPAGLTFNTSTGSISGTTSAANVNNYSILLAATDPEGASSQSFLQLNLLNSPPVYVSGIGSLSGYWDNWIGVNIPSGAFSDPNGDAVTLSVPGSNNGLVSDPINQSGVYFAAGGSGGVLNYRDIDSADAGGASKQIVLVATDSRGGTTQYIVNITVMALPPPPPPPPAHPTPPPSHPGGPPISPEVAPPRPVSVPISAITPAPAPILVPATATSVATAAAMSPAPAPLVDPLAGVRPASTASDLESFFYYDGEGRVVGAVDPEGFLTQTVYDEQDNRQQTVKYFTPVTPGSTDTLGTLIPNAGASETTTTQFDSFGRVSSVTGVDGTLTTYQYDAAGRLIREVSASGTSDQEASDTRYNAFDEVTGTLGGVGDATLGASFTEAQLDAAISAYGMTYTDDADGQKTSSVDANGNTTLFYYDADGRMLDTIDAAGDVSEAQYDSFGDVTSSRQYFNAVVSSIAASTPSTTTLTLSALQASGGGAISAALANELKGMRDGSHDEVETFTYDQRGLLLTDVDAAGYNTSDSYDQFGELYQQVRTIAKAAGSTAAVTSTTEFDYDLDGDEVATTENLGGINFNTQTGYDAFGRIVRSVDAVGKVTNTTYSKGGQTVVVTDPLGRAETTTYDALSRVLTSTDALGNTTSYVYTDATRTMTMTLPAQAGAAGITVTTTQTRNGQVFSVVDGRGVTTSYLYNADGQVTSVTQASVVTDASGNPVKNADGTTKTQTVTLSTDTYDESGRIFTSTDALGTVTQFTYNAVDQVITRQVDPSGLNLTTKYFYSTFGQLFTMTEAAGTAAVRVTDYRYDLDGNLGQVIVDPNGLKLTTTYTHDGLGNTLTVSQGTTTAPNQQATQYVYDKLGRLIRKIDAPSALVGGGSASERDLTTQYRYNAAGQVSRTIDADGNSTWFLYDADGELTQTISSLGEVSEQDYDADGRVVETRRYATALTPATVAAFGDVASGFTLTPSASDQRSYFTYDADGRQTYTLTATDSGHWSVTQNIYDANGNVIEAVAYDQPIPDSWISSVDPSGSAGITDAQVTTELTTVVYASAAASLANSERTYYAYDASNRLRFTVDALGDVSERVYDNAGDVIETVRYAAAISIPSNPIESVLSGLVNRNDSADQVTHFSYDSAGRLRYTVQVLSSDGSGNPVQQFVTERDYNGVGQITQTIAYATAFKAFLNNAYDVTTIGKALTSSASDRISEFAYDTAGRQVFSVQVLTLPGTGGAANVIQNFVTQNSYDAMGHLIASTAYAKPMTLTAYTFAALNTAVTNTSNITAQDRTTRFVYDADGRQRFIIAPDGTLSETVYDALGRVVETRQFDLTVTSATAATEVALENRRAGRHVGDGTTRGAIYSYDADGRLLSTTDAMGYVQSSAYNALGNVTSTTDQNGNVWTYGYDRLGRQTDAFSPQVAVELGAAGAATTTVSLDTHTDYDVFGNIKAQTLAYGLKDSTGASIARVTTYGYDLLNRQTTVTLPGYYDPTSGQVVATKPASSLGFQRTVQTVYDALGQVVQTKTQTGLNSYQSEYKTYDALGRQTYDVDALNHVTGFLYDAFGDQTQVTSYSVTLPVTPGPTNTSYWIDADVSKALTGDTLARTIFTVYDTLGRKTQVTQPALNNYYAGETGATVNAASITQPATAPAPTTHYDYDAFGDLIHVAVQIDSRTQDTWNYFDTLGRQILTVDASGYQTASSYDSFGNLTQTVEYAQAGALGSLGAAPPATPPTNSNDRITVYGYNARNQQTSVQRENLTYTNSADQDVNNGYSVPVTVSTTGYDGDGNVTSQTDAAGNLTTTHYNSLGQVTSVTEPARLVAPSSSVDPFLNQVSVSPVITSTLNAFGEVVQQVRSSTTAGGTVVAPSITTQQGYDFAGNLISTTDANGNVTHRQVDYAGRLIQQSLAVNVTLGNWQTVTQTLTNRYAYDADGRMTDSVSLYTDANGVLQQTGTHTAYDAFGEDVAEYKVWGTASTPIANLMLAPTGGAVPTYAIVASFTYNNAGYLASKTSADGVTQYYYNLAGQLTRQEQYALAATTNANGTISYGASTTQAARVTETDYDLSGRAVLERLPDYSAMPAGSSGDEANSPVITLITPIMQQTYDRWGNTLTSTQGGYVVNSNSAAGLVSNESRTTTYTYNADNKVTSELLPVVTAERADGSRYQAAVTYQTHYDILGNVLEQVDLADNVATAQNEATVLRTEKYEYNAASELTASVDATNVRTEYAYDANGNRVGTRDVGNGQATDAIVGTVLVDGFDANGNLISHGVLRQADGQTPYVSTGNGSVSGSGQTPVLYLLQQYQYDQANRRVVSSNVMHDVFNDIFSTYTKYDERGLVLAQRTPNIVDLPPSATFAGGPADTGIVTSYTYDQFGNRISQFDADNNGQTWFYSGDLPSSSTDSADSSTSYSADYTVGRLRHTTVGNTSTGTRTTHYQYNGFGQMTQESFTDSNGWLSTTQPNSRTYSYFENGLLEQVSDSTAPSATAPVQLQGDTSTEITSYDYDVNGEQSRILFQDIFPNSSAMSTRATVMTYDAQGRLATVGAPTEGSINLDSGTSITYVYDELGNRREIDATYNVIGNIQGTQSTWYTYDQQGRMLIVAGTLANGVISSEVQGAAEISYDALGRRYITQTYVGGNSSNNHAPSSEILETASWQQYSAQKYDYNDLGYLAPTWQGIGRHDAVVQDSFNGRLTTTRPADSINGWYTLDARVEDVLGDVTSDTQYTAVTAITNGGDWDENNPPVKVSLTTSGYLADGRSDFVDTTQYDSNGNVTLYSHLSNSYDAAGVLSHYFYSQGASLVTPDFTNTYTYTYTTEFGGYRQSTLVVSSVLGSAGASTTEPQDGTTSNQYDLRGNLVAQTISNPNETTTRDFSYDNDGQIISKTEGQTIGSAPSKTGIQDYYYVDGKQVAVLGEGLLAATQFNNDYIPTTTATSATPGTYVVNSGDTLGTIAQLMYGDAQLWYLIADANNVGFGPNDTLPSTEIGRSYRIPSAVSSQNNANTSAPYNPNLIIGDSTPSPYLAPPPGETCEQQAGQIITVAVVAAAGVAVAYFSGGALAQMAVAIAGNLLEQGVNYETGLQSGFNTNQFLVASATSAVNAVSGAVTSGFNSPLLDDVTDAFDGYVVAGALGAKPDAEDALVNGLTRFALTGAAELSVGGYDSLTGANLELSKISGTYVQVLANAINPNSGWLVNGDKRSWTNIAAATLSPFASADFGDDEASPDVLPASRYPSVMSGGLDLSNDDGIDPLSDAIQSSNLSLSGGSLAAGYGQDPGFFNGGMLEMENPLDPGLPPDVASDEGDSDWSGGDIVADSPGSPFIVAPADPYALDEGDMGSGDTPDIQLAGYERDQVPGVSVTWGGHSAPSQSPLDQAASEGAREGEAARRAAAEDEADAKAAADANEQAQAAAADAQAVATPPPEQAANSSPLIEGAWGIIESHFPASDGGTSQADDDATNSSAAAPGTLQDLASGSSVDPAQDRSWGPEPGGPGSAGTSSNGTAMVSGAPNAGPGPKSGVSIERKVAPNMALYNNYELDRGAVDALNLGDINSDANIAGTGGKIAEGLDTGLLEFRGLLRIPGFDPNRLAHFSEMAAKMGQGGSDASRGTVMVAEMAAAARATRLATVFKGLNGVIKSLQVIGKIGTYLGFATEFAQRAFGNASPAQRPVFKVIDGLIAAYNNMQFGNKFPVAAVIDSFQDKIFGKRYVPVQDTVRGSSSAFSVTLEAVLMNDTRGGDEFMRRALGDPAAKTDDKGEYGRFIRGVVQLGIQNRDEWGGRQIAWRSGQFYANAPGPLSYLERPAALIGSVPIAGQAGEDIGYAAGWAYVHVRDVVKAYGADIFGGNGSPPEPYTDIPIYPGQ